MVHLKAVAFFLLFSFQTKAHANWRLIFERAGFLGSYSAGLAYHLNELHAFELSIGSYNNDGGKYYQTNLAYKYSRWRVSLENKTWIPVQIGVFTVRSHDRQNYFLRSPSEYPSEGYYDATAFRWGFSYGTSIEFPDSNFSLFYSIKILDNGLVALYNNTHMDLQYFLSSGVGLNFFF